MKKYISVFIITALLLTTFAGFGGTALAAGEPEIKLVPDNVSANAGDKVNIEAQITSGDQELAGYSVVYNGLTLESTEAKLKPGDSNSLYFELTVTEDMLNANSIALQLYSGGIPVASDTLVITRKDQTPVIACSVTASQTLAAPDDQITFTFKIENQGFVGFTNIQIWSDSLKKGSALNSSPFNVESQNSITWPYAYKFTTAKPVVSFYITYNVSGTSESKRYDIPQQFELKEEERHVVVSLSVDDSTPDPGQEVTFTLTIKNEGNVDYTGLTVTCDGEDMGSPSRNLPQEAEFEKQYKRTFDISTDVYFTVSVKDHTGETRSVDTNTIHILLPVIPADLQNGLKIVIEPDRDVFTSAGVVNFAGYISNDSNYTLSDVSITEPSLGEVFSVSEMAPDTKLPISRPADINATTTYTFTLTVKDRNGQEYTVSSEPMTVTIEGSEEATANPGEDAVDVTLPPADGTADPLGIWFIICGVLVILIIGVGAALVVLWKRGRSPSRSSRTMAPKAKRPAARGGYSKSIKSRSYRDRNNF